MDILILIIKVLSYLILIVGCGSLLHGLYYVVFFNRHVSPEAVGCGTVFAVGGAILIAIWFVLFRLLP